MHTLVTGAPGWLGSRLLEVLCHGDPEIGEFATHPERVLRCLVAPRSDLTGLRKFPVEFVAGDVRQPDSLLAAFQGVQTVIHAAGLVHSKRTKDFYRVNTEGTANVLRAAEMAGVGRVIYISSNSAAGVQQSRSKLMSEEDHPKPYKHYGRSKLLAEQIVQSYFDSGKLETVILRPCWYYGPGQPARQTAFFRMIKSGRPFVFGDGNNLRSMTYIDNLIQAILLAERAPSAAGDSYWIADDRPYRTVEIYGAVAKLLGVVLRPRHLPAQISWLCEQGDEVLQRAGLYSTYLHVAGEMVKDIACRVDKAKRELGYSPKVELEEGMSRSIEWCNSRGIKI